MRRDELGECGNVDFFFLRFGDDDVEIRGVSSSFTSEFELWVWSFFFIGGSIYGSPTTSVLVLRYCRNVRPTWVKFDSKDTKESEWCLEVLSTKSKKRT